MAIECACGGEAEPVFDGGYCYRCYQCGHQEGPTFSALAAMRAYRKWIAKQEGDDE